MVLRSIALAAIDPTDKSGSTWGPKRRANREEEENRKGKTKEKDLSSTVTRPVVLSCACSASEQQ